MKQLIVILCISTILFSCSQNGKDHTVNKTPKDSLRSSISDSSQPHKTDKLAIANDVSIKDTTVYSNGTPPITALPFGPKVNINKLYKADSFYSKLIYKNVGKLISEGWTRKSLSEIKIYKLPIIKKIEYIKISDDDTTTCENGKTFDSILTLAKYRYKLPDIYQYQAYYMCNYDYSNNDLPTEARRYCQLFLYMSYGYLILYNPVTMNAKVVNIYHDTFRDGANFYRYFFIDKNYIIHLADLTQNSDAGDENPKIMAIGNHVVTILKNGEIKVTRSK